MKVKGENNCKVKFRNLPADSYFHFRVEYSNQKVSVYWFNIEKDAYDFCTVAEFPMDFNGIFMMTANSGVRDPDHYFIDSFALYDPSEKVAEGHNKHFHEAH